MKSKLTITLICLIIAFSQASCGHSRWHYSIEQIPAEPNAYLRDGVFVSGDYIRNASISEIDGVPVKQTESRPIKITLAEHKLKIRCSEAVGEYDSDNLAGQEKTLILNAKVQRTYIIRCIPHTHWWIEDAENKKIIAGEKPKGI